jgi:integrase
VKTLKATPIPTGAETSKPLGEWYADELNPEIAKMYIDVREIAGIARTTSARNLNVLQAALTTYVALKKLNVNPVAKWKRPPIRRRKTSASLPEWREFIAHGPPMFQDIELVQHLCVGMRPGEARLIMKSELNYQRREILIDPERTKTRKDRVAIAVPDEAWAIIEKRAAESRGPYVFVSPSDPTRTQPIPNGTMGTWLWKTQKRSGMKGRGGENLVRYSARHGGINDRIDQNFTPGNVAAMAGVSLDVMERHYMRLSETRSAEMREAMNRQGLTPIDGGKQRKGPAKIPGKLPRTGSDDAGDDDE